MWWPPLHQGHFLASIDLKDAHLHILAVALLRQRGITMLGYLDDLLLRAESVSASGGRRDIHYPHLAGVQMDPKFSEIHYDPDQEAGLSGPDFRHGIDQGAPSTGQNPEAAVSSLAIAVP